MFLTDDEYRASEHLTDGEYRVWRAMAAFAAFAAAIVIAALAFTASW